MNIEEHSEAVISLLSQAPGWEEMPKFKILPSENTYRIRFIGQKDGIPNGIELDYRISPEEEIHYVVNSINDGSRGYCGYYNAFDEELFMASISHLPRYKRRKKIKDYKKSKKNFVRR